MLNPLPLIVMQLPNVYHHNRIGPYFYSLDDLWFCQIDIHRDGNRRIHSHSFLDAEIEILKILDAIVIQVLKPVISLSALDNVRLYFLLYLFENLRIHSKIIESIV